MWTIKIKKKINNNNANFFEWSEYMVRKIKCD